MVKPPLFSSSKLLINGRDRSKLTERLSRQVDAVKTTVADFRPDVPVHGALCFVDAGLPLFGTLNFDGYPLLYRKALAKRLNRSGPLDEAVVRLIAAELAARLRPA